jgi:hypothetical protein
VTGLDIDTGSTLSVGANGDSYTLSGGTLTVNGYEYVAYEGTGTFTQSGGSNTTTAELVIGGTSGATGTYTLSSGTLNTGTIEIGGAFGSAGGSGTLSVTGSTATVNAGAVDIYTHGNLNQTNGAFISSGTITQSGGQATVSGLDLDTVTYLTIGTAGHSYALSSGTFTDNSYAYVGYQGSGSFTQTGGTATIANDLDIAVLSTGTGTYTLSGAGTLNISGNLNIGGSGGSAGGSGTLTLSNGTISVTGTTYLFNNSTLTQTGSGTFEFGSVNQSGGTASFASFLTVDATIGSNTMGS